MNRKHAILALVLSAAMVMLPTLGLAAAGEWTRSSRHNYEVRLDQPSGGEYKPGDTLTIKFSMRDKSSKGTSVSAYLAKDNWGLFANAKKNAIASFSKRSLANGVFSTTLKIPSTAADGSYRLWVEVVDKGYDNDDGPQMFTFLTIKKSSTNTTQVVDKNGWVKTGNYWYYYRNNAMVKGWLRDGGFWYYTDSNGRMRTGWLKLGNSYYYMEGSGKMRTGWLQEGGNWYYFNGSGIMATGWAKIGSAWYYFNSSGKMYTGWLKSGGKWYYLHDSSGKMLTGNVTLPNGQKQRFDSNGVWLGANG